MSIHDVDKSGERRDSPTPNSSDGSGEIRMAHQTVSSHYQPPGVPVTARLKQVGKTIIANDGTTNVSTYGYNPALNKWGLFVAKPGVDVMTNTDPGQLIFNSSQDTFKVVGKFNMTSIAFNVIYANNTVSGSNTTTLPHGLGYTPAFLAFVNVGSTYLPLPLTSAAAIAGTGIGNLSLVAVQLSSDNTNFTLRVDQTMSTTTSGTANVSAYPVVIYALQETAN